MPPRREDKSITYELAVGEITETFDPLQIAPRAAPSRDWVMESQAADILGVTKKALERRRSRGTGPTSHRRAGYVAYYLDDLDAWVASKPKAYRPPPSP
jgi:hypothetical protein